ncbi:rhombosortase [Opitutaceae bacterium EW11]|nr:rhombosortase [Opitutaceae bacterium EW11]
MPASSIPHRPLPWATFLIAAAVLAVAVVPGADSLLEWERHAFSTGEAWRLATGHLTHFGWNHLVWDLAAFVGLGVFVERLGRTRYLVSLGMSAVVISLGVIWFQPDLATYRGLSGLDSTLFAMVCAHLLALSRRRGDLKLGLLASAALLGFLAKCGFELHTGATVFVDSGAAGFRPVPLAHLLGAVTGLVAMLVPGAALPLPRMRAARNVPARESNAS